MYISNICFKKIFSDKIVANFEIQEVGPKWHLESTIFQIFTRKMCFKISLFFVGKILKSRVFLKSSLLAVYRRPLKWLWDILLGRKICSQSSAIIFKNQQNSKFSRVREMFCSFSIWSSCKVIKQRTSLNSRSGVYFRRPLEHFCSHFLPREK